MKVLIAATLGSALVLAACADQPNYAANDDVTCKTAPVTAQAAAGGQVRMTGLDQRMSEMWLANSNYRQMQRERNPGYENNIERTLQDCGSISPLPGTQTSDAGTAAGSASPPASK
jgi:hypothetical protein